MEYGRPPTRYHSSTAALLHPAWWLALAALVLNDRFFKGWGALPSWFTGKLSDVAGMIVAPVVVAVLIRRRSWQTFILSHVIVGGAFIALKLSERCARWGCDLGALLRFHWRVAHDPTDLLARRALAFSIWCFGSAREPEGGIRKAWKQALAGCAEVVGLLSIMATSQPPPKSPTLASNVAYVEAHGQMRSLDRTTGRTIATFEVGRYTRKLVSENVLSVGTNRT